MLSTAALRPTAFTSCRQDAAPSTVPFLAPSTHLLTSTASKVRHLEKFNRHGMVEVPWYIKQISPLEKMHLNGFPRKKKKGNPLGFGMPMKKAVVLKNVIKK